MLILHSSLKILHILFDFNYLAKITKISKNIFKYKKLQHMSNLKTAFKNLNLKIKNIQKLPKNI